MKDFKWASASVSYVNTIQLFSSGREHKRVLKVLMNMCSCLLHQWFYFLYMHIHTHFKVITPIRAFFHINITDFSMHKYTRVYICEVHAHTYMCTQACVYMYFSTYTCVYIYIHILHFSNVMNKLKRILIFGKLWQLRSNWYFSFIVI